MTTEFSKHLESKSRHELVLEIKERRLNGESAHAIQIELYNFMKDNEVSIEYEDYLDDLISALEGWCDKSYVLHPSQFKKER